MRLHHTKNKGDLGVLYAQLDLARRGYSVLLPLTEHEAFDLVGYKDRRFLRVQVKYRAAKAGVIQMRMASSWADRRGTHVVPIDRGAIDVICVYCPETNACYYLDPKAFRGSVCLRVDPTRNQQQEHVRWAQDYLEIPTTVCGVPASVIEGLEDITRARQSREPRARWLVSAHSSAG